MKKLVCILLTITMAVTLSACGADDITDQIANVVQEEDEHVLSVKNGTPNAYPGKKYGETFDNFFASPTWKYFVGTKEGEDEDGDGNPDYTEENVEIVEFTGYCTYQEVEVKALIQFTLNEEDGTFEASYLSFNDVPQNMLMLSALLEAAFTDEDMDDTVKNNSVKTEQESNSAEIEQENNSTETEQENDYALLDEFISLICSYSDPPEYEGDELTEYFKEQFDLWLSGDGYNNIMTDADGHLVIPDHTAEYAGTWWDMNSKRCYMEISSSDGIYYSIDINWANGASDNTHWSLWGTYDENAGGIHYYGSRIEEHYPDDGEMQETHTYSDGEGLIWIGDDSMLYWEDYTEQQGNDCYFEREE